MDPASVDRVQLSSGSVAFRRAGDGPALVLLHGFLCDSRVWREQLVLADRFTVVAWDAPGAGGSSDPPEGCTIGDWARQLAEFLDAVGIERAHVLGLSWGGLLAQSFYAAYRSRVSSLILADTYAGWRGSFGPQIAGQRLERCERDASLPVDRFVQAWVPQFFTDTAPSELVEEMSTIVSSFHPSGFRMMARTLAETDSTALLATIAVPTLLLWGEDDRRSPLEVAEGFRDRIPQAELHVIPDAGHVSNMEQPDRFNADVARFCGSVR